MPIFRVLCLTLNPSTAETPTDARNTARPPSTAAKSLRPSMANPQLRRSREVLEKLTPGVEGARLRLQRVAEHSEFARPFYQQVQIAAVRQPRDLVQRHLLLSP